VKAGIFNPYLDTLGGGERYTVGVINAFTKKGYKVYVEWKDKSIIVQLEKRFGVDFNGVEVVESVERGDGYDACFWVSDGSIPTLRSRNNILHFQVPFTKVGGKNLINRMKLFRVKYVVVNSQFTKKIIDSEYGVDSKVIYPPVSVAAFKPRRKRNIICYVGRFSRLAQAKRQDILIEVFKEFYKKNKNWKLVLAGGAEVGNDGLVQKLLAKAKKYPVEILESPSFSEIRELLGVSKMFWSAAGYGVNESQNPVGVEHFGITVVEAMAAKAVPLVHARGGPKEIIEDGKTGFLWNKKSELLKNSQRLADNFGLWRGAAKEANMASKKFSGERFEAEFVELI
jgi:glycosyltransferase involved in cell wall biosynthesis